MGTLIRTDMQIKTLIDALKSEMDKLGESNEESKAEIRNPWDEMFYALIDETVQETASEIEDWLTNEQSCFGKDYGVE